MTLERRIEALENRASGGADDTPVDWGRGFEHLPPATHSEIKALVQWIRDSGAGKLPISKSIHANKPLIELRIRHPPLA